MKITAIETIRLPDRPNLLLAQVHTDEGLVGLGETSRGAAAVEAQIHELVAPYLLGKDPLAIQLAQPPSDQQLSRIREQQRRDARGLGDRHRAVGPLRPGPESADLPVARREEPRADPRLQHLRRLQLQHSHGRTAQRRRGRAGARAGRPLRRSGRVRASRRRARAEPAVGGLHRDEDLAVRSVRRAHRRQPAVGARILQVGLQPYRKIREAVGDRIEIMAEFHSLWNLDQAKRIARALEEYRPFWSEDPIKMCDVATLKDYAQSTRIPGVRQRDAGRHRAVSRHAAGAGRRRGDAGCGLVRRLDRSAQDRGAGRGLSAPGRAARLQRSGGVGRFDPSHAAHPQRAGDGSGACVLTARGTRTSSPSCRW